MHRVLSLPNPNELNFTTLQRLTTGYMKMVWMAHINKDVWLVTGYQNADDASVSESSSDIIELNEAEYTKKLGNANPKHRNSNTPRIETDVWPHGESLNLIVHSDTWLNPSLVNLNWTLYWFQNINFNCFFNIWFFVYCNLPIM